MEFNEDPFYYVALLFAGVLVVGGVGLGEGGGKGKHWMKRLVPSPPLASSRIVTTIPYVVWSHILLWLEATVKLHRQTDLILNNVYLSFKIRKSLYIFVHLKVITRINYPLSDIRVIPDELDNVSYFTVW